MTILPPDQRRVINPNSTEFNTFPFPAVTAIDSQIITPPDDNAVIIEDHFNGSGIMITPNHVLTAAHVVQDLDKPSVIARNVRVTTSAKQNDLVSRLIGDPEDRVAGRDRNVNYSDIYFLGDDFRLKKQDDDDIALLRINQPLLSANEVIGLIAFVDPDDAQGFTIKTAGYPYDNVSQPIFGNSGAEGRDLVVAPGDAFLGRIESIDSQRLFLTNNNIDNYKGQSGSGVWSSYQGDDLRVMGLLNFEESSANGGIIITTDLYDEIIDLTEDISVNGNSLPENLIIGSDPSFLGLIGGNDQIFGTYRRERIIGNKGDDILFGKGANDRLEGNEGDDQLIGGAGDDKLDGGTNTFTLNPLDNEQENDVAIFSGNRIEYDIDTETIGDIFGLGGTTTTTITHLNGGVDGVDTLTNIEYVQFKDQAIAFPFDPDDPNLVNPINFTGGNSNDTLIGNILNNLLLGNGGSDRLEGKQGKDTLKGNDGNDSLFGGDGNDLLQGGKNKDQLNGNGGGDRVFGDLGNDLLKGEGEDDYLGSGDGNDTVKGGTGNDSIAGGNGNDTLQGGDGNDNLNGNGGSDRVFGDLGNDLMQGGTGNDYLSGNNGNDTLKGQSGIDSLAGGNGLDLLQGGDGNDNLNGNGGSDRVFGDLGNDLLEGGTGNDYLSGGNGFDTLTGGFGRDTLAGGVGQDSFLFERVDQLVDEVTDFNVEDDTLLFTASNLAGVSNLGVISPEIFTIGGSANDSGDRFIYNAGSGDLFYDSDGIGSSLQIKLAQLDSNLSLTSNNFQVV